METFLIFVVVGTYQNEDGYNQKGKNIIGEAGGKADIASQIKERRDGSVDADPDTDPCVEGKKGDILHKRRESKKTIHFELQILKSTFCKLTILLDIS